MQVINSITKMARELQFLTLAYKQPQFSKAQGFLFSLSEYFSLETGSTQAHILLESR